MVLNIPETPVRSTNANGIVGYDLYEVSYKVQSNVSKVPTISAAADDKNVGINITQAVSVFQPAVVQFDYKGVVKTYNVVFVTE